LIRIYGERYEVDKFIEECLPIKCWMQKCEDQTHCAQCVANAYGLEIHYDKEGEIIND